MWGILPYIPRIYRRKGRQWVSVLRDGVGEEGIQTHLAVLNLKLGKPEHFLNIHNEPFFSMKIAGYSGTLPVTKSQQSLHDLIAYFRNYFRDKESGSKLLQRDRGDAQAVLKAVQGQAEGDGSPLCLRESGESVIVCGKSMLNAKHP